MAKIDNECVKKLETTDMHVQLLSPTNKNLRVQAKKNTTTRVRHIISLNGQETYLTIREIDCIRQLCMGKTMKGIASCLSLSPRTIETHLRNIKYKLKCNYKSQIIGFFLKDDGKFLL